MVVRHVDYVVLQEVDIATGRPKYARGSSSSLLGRCQKSISKTNIQVNKFDFWSPALQGTFDSSGVPQGSIFRRAGWPGDVGFEILRATSACALKGSKFSGWRCDQWKNHEISGPGKIDFQERLSSQKFQFFAAGAQLHF